MAERIVRRAWARSQTMSECAERLHVSRFTLYRLRDEAPDLFS